MMHQPQAGILPHPPVAAPHRNEPPMELSAFFPTRTIGNDPAKIRDWAQAAEDLGYDHIEVPDHVFGATRAWRLAADLHRKRCVPRNLYDACVPCRRDQKTKIGKRRADSSATSDRPCR